MKGPEDTAAPGDATSYLVIQVMGGRHNKQGPMHLSLWQERQQHRDIAKSDRPNLQGPSALRRSAERSVILSEGFRANVKVIG